MTKNQVIKLGMIGLGQRGKGLLDMILAGWKDVSVVAVCDAYEDRVEAAAEAVKAASGVRPTCESDYKKVLANPEVKAVIIATSWEMHVTMAVEAMYAGKVVGLEVGGTFDINECWKLVDAYEETKTPFMFMENCNYGRRELMALNMAEQGVFGEIVHCAGGYMHDLRKEVAYGVENRHYRLEKYKTHNAENYPTHELGPLAKILHINHGNRLESLVSVASKAAGLHEYILKNKADDEELKNTIFKQGDVVTTVIRCAQGQTITMTLNTTLPRYYSRGFTVCGTKGMYEEATDSVYMDNGKDEVFHEKWLSEKGGNAKEYEEEYDHPLWKKHMNGATGVMGDHGGADGLMLSVFFDCVRYDKTMPIDVYDAATWMAVTALSEQSIANGSVPVEFPDFTKGKWMEK